MSSLGETRSTSALDFGLRIDKAGVRKVFAGMPMVAYFWFRDFLFRSFQRHRMRWFAAKGTRFGREGGIQVWPINDGPSAPGNNDVVYSVKPEARRQPDRYLAEAGLEQLRADAFTGNNVLPVHEFGRDIRSPDWMAIPVRTTEGSPSAWRANNPGKTLVARPSRRDGKILLYEVQQKRGRGRPRAGAIPRERLRLRFLLTHAVDMKPTLKMYDTWDRLQQDRDELWGEAADKMLRDFERGDPRDL